MENLTQKWTQSGHSLQNQDTFFSIFKIGQGGLPPSPLVVRLNVISELAYTVFDQNHITF